MCPDLKRSIRAVDIFISYCYSRLVAFNPMPTAPYSAPSAPYSVPQRGFFYQTLSTAALCKFWL